MVAHQVASAAALLAGPSLAAVSRCSSHRRRCRRRRSHRRCHRCRVRRSSAEFDGKGADLLWERHAEDLSGGGRGGHGHAQVPPVDEVEP